MDCHISSDGDNVSIDGRKKWYEGNQKIIILLRLDPSRRRRSF